MKIVFFGTPDYVLPIVEAIHRRFSRRGISPIAGVVTQPPRPVGRKQLKVFSPVDSWAFKKKLPIFHSCQEFLNSGEDADVGVLAAYGEIIPASIITHFPFGILNVHPSLLPKWRGAAPVQAPLVAGEKETGVSIIKLDAKLDHGPVVSQFKEEIFDTDTTEILRKRLFQRGAEVLAELIEPYLKGKITPREQNHKEATSTTQIKKEDAFIPPDYLRSVTTGQGLAVNWEIGFIKNFSIQPTTASINQFIKAMSPWPVAWTYVQLVPNTKNVTQKRLKILKAHTEEEKLVLDNVQLEGKGAVSWKQFKEAYPTAAFKDA